MVCDQLGVERFVSTLPLLTLCSNLLVFRMFVAIVVTVGLVPASLLAEQSGNLAKDE